MDMTDHDRTLLFVVIILASLLLCIVGLVTGKLDQSVIVGLITTPIGSILAFMIGRTTAPPVVAPPPPEPPAAAPMNGANPVTVRASVVDVPRSASRVATRLRYTFHGLARAHT